MKMKKFLAILLAVLMLAGLAPLILIGTRAADTYNIVFPKATPDSTTNQIGYKVLPVDRSEVDFEPPILSKDIDNDYFFGYQLVPEGGSYVFKVVLYEGFRGSFLLGDNPEVLSKAAVMEKSRMIVSVRKGSTMGPYLEMGGDDFKFLGAKATKEYTDIFGTEVDEFGRRYRWVTEVFFELNNIDDIIYISVNNVISDSNIGIIEWVIRIIRLLINLITSSFSGG